MKNRFIVVAAFAAAMLLLPSHGSAQVSAVGAMAPGTIFANASCNQGGGIVSPSPRPVSTLSAQPADAYQTAFDYLATFYPRWFYYYQSALPPCNQLIGPDRVSPLYHTIVAINVDTLYVSMIVGVKKEPVIMTVPPTADNYSILQLDGYGDVFPGIPNNQPGVYALTGPDWQGTLPPDVIPVPVPYNYSVLAVRADKYVHGVDMREEAERFRRALHAAPLSEWENDHDAGATRIVSEAYFAIPFKGIADRLAQNHPILFLKMLQNAVLAATTQPLTPAEQALSDEFNALFSDQGQWPELGRGASAAHAAILANYHSHTFPGTNWITFTDIGKWDQTFQGYLNRSSIAEYIQVANNHDAAVYYHTFLDGNGVPLDGTSHAYMLRFPPNGQPDVNRFWSVTAYLPGSIELVPNDADKYAVASYTPGLVTAGDGSVTILMSSSPPAGFPEANWLPVPKGRFNIMIRAYGPQGSVKDNTYSPPPIVGIGASN